MGTLSGSSITSSITSMLNNTYSVLANASNGNVTLENINDVLNNSDYASSLNQTFASYLISNFSTYDKDGDGVISAAEMQDNNSSLTTTGLTQAELTSLGAASGLSSKALSEVLNHFQEIDTNGDGRVTSAEINAFNYTSAAEKKKIEFSNKFASNMSVYYGDDSSAANNSSSLLSSRYLSDD